jgi:carbon monoxide dehydrogenase subunit G
MQFENAFELAGAPGDVSAVFEDVPLLASFLPGASVGERKEDGSYPGQLTVAFGPKRLAFKGTLTNAVQREQLAGELSGAASADVRGAKMMVNMRYKLSPAAGGTRVELVSEAELTGMLAEFAQTGGVVVTQALLDEFAKNFSAHMRATSSAQGTGAAEAAPPRPAQALSAFALLWQILKNLFSRRAPPRA